MEAPVDPPSRLPKILVVSVLPYLFSAKLVLGLEETGFAVAVVCPSHHHPIHQLRNPPRRYPLGIAGANSLGRFGAVASIQSAIVHSAPDVIVPCDDQAARIVRSIALYSSPQARHLFERSLGPIETYAVLESRTAQVELAQRRNVRTPRFKIVEQTDCLERALDEIGLPVFMKRDDSWAGQGVRKIRDRTEAYAAWHALSTQHSLLQAVKNARTMGIRHAMSGIRSRRPSIHLQAAVAGRPANRAILARQGNVIGGLSVVAVEASSETGPASVVRVIDHPEMSGTVEILARELRLNGLVGFDFVLGDKGEAYFLEINARATPAATLSLSGAPDLLELLFHTITGSWASTRRSADADTIALFPDEMLRDENSPFLSSAYHDIPTDEPGLVEFGLEQVRAKERLGSS